MHDRGETSRKKATFFYNGAEYDYLGAHTEEGKWIAQDIRYPNIKKHVVGSRADTDGLAINGNSGLAQPMIRLAEVYLLYVESIIGLNASTADVEALTYFNMVRERADMPNVSTITLDDLWDERRVELAIEGQFWYDMVRRAYWDEEWVLNFMSEQHRSEYYYYYTGSAPNGFAWRNITADIDMNPPSPERLLLPYPATELVLNPLLREDPAPFDFSGE